MSGITRPERLFPGDTLRFVHPTPAAPQAAPEGPRRAPAQPQPTTPAPQPAPSAPPAPDQPSFTTPYAVGTVAALGVGVAVHYLLHRRRKGRHARANRTERARLRGIAERPDAERRAGEPVRAARVLADLVTADRLSRRTHSGRATRSTAAEIRDRYANLPPEQAEVAAWETMLAGLAEAGALDVVVRSGRGRYRSADWLLDLLNTVELTRAFEASPITTAPELDALDDPAKAAEAVTTLREGLRRTRRANVPLPRWPATWRPRFLVRGARAAHIVELRRRGVALRFERQRLKAAESEAAESRAADAQRGFGRVYEAALDYAAINGVPEKVVGPILDRESLTSRERAGRTVPAALVGILGGAGTAAATLPFAATDLFATQFGVDATSVIQLGQVAFGATAAGLLWGSVRANVWTVRTILVRGLITAGALVGIAVAPSFAWIPPMFLGIGLFDSVEGYARDRLDTVRPLPRRDAERRTAIVNSWWNLSAGTMPIGIVGLIGAFGLKPALAIAGVAVYAPITIAVTWALRGGPPPPRRAPVSRLWQQTRRRTAAAGAAVGRAWTATRRAPVGVARRSVARLFKPTPYHLVLAGGSTDALLVGGLGVLVGVYLGDLEAATTAAVVTLAAKVAASIATARWGSFVAGRMSATVRRRLPVAATLIQVAAFAGVAALPLYYTAGPIVFFPPFIASAIASQLIELQGFALVDEDFERSGVDPQLGQVRKTRVIVAQVAGYFLFSGLTEKALAAAGTPAVLALYGGFATTGIVYGALLSRKPLSRGPGAAARGDTGGNGLDQIVNLLESARAAEAAGDRSRAHELYGTAEAHTPAAIRRGGPTARRARQLGEEALEGQQRTRGIEWPVPGDVAGSKALLEREEHGRSLAADDPSALRVPRVTVASLRGMFSHARLGDALDSEGGRVRLDRSGGGLVSALGRLASRSWARMRWVSWAYEGTRELLGTRGRLDVPVDAASLEGFEYDSPFVFSGPAVAANMNRILHPWLAGLLTARGDELATLLAQTAFPHQAFWQGYDAVNADIAAEILRQIEGRENPIVLIEDYQLMTVAPRVRASRADARLAWFDHYPFLGDPADLALFPEEVVRTLLLGVLANNVAGFHTRRDAQNFLTAVRERLPGEATVVAPQGLPERIVAVVEMADGRRVWVGRYPLPIDPKRFERMFEDEDTAAAIAAREAEIAAERERGVEVVIGRVDRADKTKNLIVGLDALEEFLEARPDLVDRERKVGRVAYIAIHDKGRYPDYVAQVQGRVDRINNNFRFTRDDGSVYEPVRVTWEADTALMVALQRQADVWLGISLREGMYLAPKEAVHNNQRALVVIISTETGAIDELDEDGLPVHPVDRARIVAALGQAVDMPEDERAARLERLKAVVRERAPPEWIFDRIWDLWLFHAVEHRAAGAERPAPTPGPTPPAEPIGFWTRLEREITLEARGGKYSIDEAEAAERAWQRRLQILRVYYHPRGYEALDRVTDPDAFWALLELGYGTAARPSADLEHLLSELDSFDQAFGFGWTEAGLMGEIAAALQIVGQHARELGVFPRPGTLTPAGALGLLIWAERGQPGVGLTLEQIRERAGLRGFSNVQPTALDQLLRGGLVRLRAGTVGDGGLAYRLSPRFIALVRAGDRLDRLERLFGDLPGLTAKEIAALRADVAGDQISLILSLALGRLPAVELKVLIGKALLGADDLDKAVKAALAAHGMADDATATEAVVRWLEARAGELSARFTERPGRTLLGTDFDGTAAPLVDPAKVRPALDPRVAELFAAGLDLFADVVAFTGRDPATAYAMDAPEGMSIRGLSGAAFASSAQAELEFVEGYRELGAQVQRFAARHHAEFEALGATFEDKGVHWVWVWRGAPDTAAVYELSRRVAELARAEGLEADEFAPELFTLEIRPRLVGVELTKATSFAAHLSWLAEQGRAVERVVYADDSSNGLSAFRWLAERRRAGELDVLLVAVRHGEGNADLNALADVIVDGVAGWRDLLARLIPAARATRPPTIRGGAGDIFFARYEQRYGLDDRARHLLREHPVGYRALAPLPGNLFEPVYAIAQEPEGPLEVELADFAIAHGLDWDEATVTDAAELLRALTLVADGSLAGPVKLGVLFVGAHPDDEAGFANPVEAASTHIGSLSPYAYWREHFGIRTGVATITRGEGSANAAGDEEGVALGLRREAEEREAVAHAGIDHVYYLDGLDFYYTTSASLAASVWGERTLERLVRLIRTTRPELIVTMNPSPAAGNHGHHQMAARLAIEAFEAAADPARFPNQLTDEGLAPWRVRRLLRVGAAGTGSETGPASEDDFTADEPTDIVYSLFSGRPLGGSTGAQIERGAQRAYATQGWSVAPDAPTDPERVHTVRFTEVATRVAESPERAGVGAALGNALVEPPTGLPLGSEVELDAGRFDVAAGETFTLSLRARVVGGTGGMRAVLRLPAGWRGDGIARLDADGIARFEVTPPPTAEPGRLVRLSARVIGRGRTGVVSTVVRLAPAVRGEVVPLAGTADFRAWANAVGRPVLAGLLPTRIAIGVGETLPVTVTLSNFTARTQSGTVTLRLPAGFGADEAAKPYAGLAPGESGSVRFEVTNTDPTIPNAIDGGDYPIVVETTSDGATSRREALLNLVPTTTVPVVDTAPGLNGDPADYPVDEIDASRVWDGSAHETVPDTSAGVRLVRHGDDLYVLVRVSDEAPGSLFSAVEGKQFERTNGIEIALDPRPGGRPSENTSTTLKLGVMPRTSDGGPVAYRFLDNRQGPASETAPGLGLAAGLTDPYSGYWVELRIPLALLPAAPVDGRVGLNVFVYDPDPAQPRIGRRRTAWSPFGGVQGDPYRWGVMTLEGYSAPRDRPAEPVEAIIPGEAARSVLSPQSILQATRDGVALAAGVPAGLGNTATLSGAPVVTGEGVTFTLGSTGRGTANAFLTNEAATSRLGERLGVAIDAGGAEIEIPLGQLQAERLAADGGRLLVSYETPEGRTAAVSTEIPPASPRPHGGPRPQTARTAERHPFPAPEPSAARADSPTTAEREEAVEGDFGPLAELIRFARAAVATGDHARARELFTAADELAESTAWAGVRDGAPAPVGHEPDPAKGILWKRLDPAARARLGTSLAALARDPGARVFGRSLTPRERYFRLAQLLLLDRIANRHISSRAGARAPRALRRSGAGRRRNGRGPEAEVERGIAA